MNLCPRFAGAGLAVIALVSTAARAEIEFVGLLATPDKTLFALSDTSDPKSAWVGIGQHFSGYSVTRYSAGDDTLILTKDGTERRVRLKDDAKIRSARFELTGTVTFGGDEKLQVVRATLLYDQENIFPLKDGVTYRITPKRLPDNTIMYKTSIERSLAPNKTERIAAPSVIVWPGQSFSMNIADLGFAFTPRIP